VPRHSTCPFSYLSNPYVDGECVVVHAGNIRAPRDALAEAASVAAEMAVQDSVDRFFPDLVLCYN
jgi:hypothetical protein